MLCTCTSQCASIVILTAVQKRTHNRSQFRKVKNIVLYSQCQISLLFHLLIKELQELHSALEEAKADIVGLWALKFLIDKVSSVFIFYFF